jgi:hypothetical protein
MSINLMPLIQLTYKSSATNLFTEGQLASILASSAKNNEINQITGMLLYSEGCFIEVLEGESIPMQQVMMRIKADPRHESFNILGIQAINTREFPNWRIAFNLRGDDGLLNHPSRIDFFSPSFDSYKAHINYGPALIALKAFANQLAL